MLWGMVPMRYSGNWAHWAPSWVQRYMAFIVVSIERCMMLGLMIVISARVKRADGLLWSVFPYRALWILGFLLLELALAVVIHYAIRRAGLSDSRRSLFGVKTTAHGGQMEVQALHSHGGQLSAVVPADQPEARASATGVRSVTVVTHGSQEMCGSE